MQLQLRPAEGELEYNHMADGGGDGGGEGRRRTTVSTHRVSMAALWCITSFVALGLSVASLLVALSHSAVTTTAAVDRVDSRLTVAQLASGYFNNLDLRQWNLTLDFFEDTYVSDYNIEGATPMTLNREINWLVWPCFLAGFNTTHHQLGNIVVDFAGVDPATAAAVANLTAKVTATHNFDGSLWRTAGIYDMRLRRHADGPFRLFYIKYRQHWMTGDETTLSRLAKIAAWEKNGAFCAAHGGTKPTSSATRAV
jgi:hypothetical protein